MPHDIIDNRTRELAPEINNSLADSIRAHFAVGYFFPASRPSPSTYYRRQTFDPTSYHPHNPHLPFNKLSPCDLAVVPVAGRARRVFEVP
jgi:hypothetical protein